MAINNNEENTNTVNESNEAGASKKTSPVTVKFSDLLALSIKYWYWFLCSLIICLGFSWFYVKRTVPLYTQSMSVLLRDNVEGSGMGASTLNLEELGFKTSYTILEDEMEALRSPDLMQQVIVKLNLNTLYSTPGTFHKNVLYGSELPVKVSFPDMQPDESASMRISIDKEGAMTLDKLVVGAQPCELAEGQTLNFGDAINTPSGRVIIQKTPFFKEDEEYVIDINHLSLEQATLKFCGEMTTEMSSNKKSNVINMTCVDESRARADEILSTLLDCYTQNWLTSKAQTVATTNDFITQRLRSIEQELSGVDNSISAFKSTNLIPDVSQTSNIYMKESNDIDNQILNFNSQLQMARYLKSFISSEGKDKALPQGLGLPNTNIEGLVGQYNTLIMQRKSFLQNTSDTNPLVIEIDSQLATLRSSILASLDNIIVSLSNSVMNLERRQKSSTARVAASPQQARYLLSAERKQKVQESLYLYLLQKREENELSQSIISVNTRVLKQPSGPKIPSSPKPRQTYFFAFIIGLLIPAGAIYVLEINNNKVRGRKDLDGMTVPVAGEIPSYRRHGQNIKYFKSGKDKADAKSEIVVKDGNRDMVNEAIRVLRSNITRMTGGDSSTVIMVTSFNPGSGKTFLSMNLGLSLALKHHKVLLIDGDLRRASLSRFVGSPRKGIADYLSGACTDIDAVIHKNVEAEGLDLLPVGAIPPNPTELLESSRFNSLIAHLRTEYQYILIDCPPGEMMADAQIIGDVSDRTIFMIRVGLFQRGLLPEVEALYKSKKYPNMMVVLNDSMVGGHNGYGYGYSYGYGYGTKDGKKYYE